ncbi:GNAT family N-acetyltransferase [Pseudonocardia sp.]|uniref:GNAT family N-acetyltransferase n=1 Tax=Pseudonocardia sp. TaxID=60912 RepID=UPI003D145517
MRPEARVAVLSGPGGALGFFPFETGPFGYGKPIAAGLTDCQGLVHAPGLEWDPRELLRRCGLAIWEFDHLVCGLEPLEPFVLCHAPSPVIDLRGGFPAYLAGRTASRIRDLPRRRRKLTREHGEPRFVYNSDDRAALRTVLAWKSAQYRRTGRSDRFARRWIVELVETLLATRTPAFSGLLSVLYAGDTIVAGHVGLRSEQVVPTWFPAYNPDFARYSPGLLLHLELARAAADAGVLQVDLGRGAKDYKEWLKTGDLTVAEGRVTRRVPGAALHWARREPARRLRNTVTAHPVLFRAADRALKATGRVRIRTATAHPTREELS